MFLILVVAGAFIIPYYYGSEFDSPYTREEVSETFENYVKRFEGSLTTAEKSDLKSFLEKYHRVLFSADDLKNSINKGYYSYALLMLVAVLLHIKIVISYVRKTSL